MKKCMEFPDASGNPCSHKNIEYAKKFWDSHFKGFYENIIGNNRNKASKTIFKKIYYRKNKPISLLKESK